ncbi:MAG: hypothetical protein HUJ58_09980, partial [Erysipelotrichaceae bacterium]|nr:hypothetical protein [Erysipelotrichaceae bacterium]
MAVITRLDWQRVQMEVTCVSDCPLEALGLAKKGTKEIVRLSDVTVNGKEYSCVNNLAAMREETFLDNGSYYFVCLTEGIWNKCQVSTEVGYSLPEKTRVFRYCTNLYYAETVDFWIETDEKDKDLYLMMNHYFMKENKNWKVRNYAEAFEGKKKLKEWAHGVAVWGLNVVYNVLYALRKHDGKHILLMSETRPYLWGNLLAVDTELKNMGMDREYTVSYSFRKSVGESQGFASWLKLVGLLSKQDYVFVDDYTQIFNFLQLNPKTVLTQTWHAAVGFKEIG